MFSVKETVAVGSSSRVAVTITGPRLKTRGHGHAGLAIYARGRGRAQRRAVGRATGNIDAGGIGAVVASTVNGMGNGALGAPVWLSPLTMNNVRVTVADSVKLWLMVGSS